MAVTRYINRFPELMALANSKTMSALDRAAEDIQSGAMDRSRVDTGNMRGGWTTERLNNWSRLVYNPVYYTIFNEDGTIYMSAQPMLGPAVAEVEPKFIADIREAWYGG